jgi:hypothetical protein
MTSDELMAKLQGLFPASFPTRDALLAWSEVARTALGSYQGGTLQRAYDRVLADWRHGYAPKPADFVSACQEVRSQLHRPAGAPPQFSNGAERAALTAALDIAFADFRRIEREEDKAGRSRGDRVREAYDVVEQIEERIIATKPPTAEDAVAQMVLGISRLPQARDWVPLEPDPEATEAIKFATEACGAFHSALDALRAGGFLKISDQMLDYYAAPWQSPWLVLAEAERLRQVACNRPQGPGA